MTIVFVNDCRHITLARKKISNRPEAPERESGTSSVRRLAARFISSSRALMTDDAWDEFAEAVEFRVRKRPMKRPSERDLDAFEETFGFRLPLSYRSFVKQFGAGALRVEFTDDSLPSDEFWFYAPGNPKNRFNSSLDQHVGDWRKSLPDDRSARHFPEPALARRLVVFACDALGDRYFGWDPQEATDADGSDHAVYCLERDDPLIKVERVADSFTDFVLGYCLDRCLKEGLPPRRKKGLKIERTYCRY